MSFRTPIYLFSTLFILAACGGGGSTTSTGAEADNKETTASPAGNTIVDPDAGKITGSVKFSGQQPPKKKVSMGADAYCKGAHTEAVYSDEVVVNPNGTLKNVYVYVKSGLDGKTFPNAGDSALLNQIGCIYVPHVLAVQANQDIVIKNSDNVLHNVNARPENNKGFNIGQPVKGMETKKSFNNPEVGIPVKCDVHPWMKSYIHVAAHPYGIVTDDNGAFTLENLPPGEYEVEAWHESLGTSTQKVVVGAKEDKAVSFTFKGA